MEATVRKNYAESLPQQQIEVSKLVMDGLKQAKEEKTEDLELAADYIAFDLKNPSAAVWNSIRIIKFIM